ncbi:MAG: Holliday junction resolvase RuvX [Synergistaceae bacterium]|nr:Holliday junction resolvase RuvX [Synergistaceae bacterium]MBQ4419509.1 Holliday junction resolvase RuvX [Synergistaceae bacterium]MBQ7570538.1 Holliday junction resolvase RuvX [Synergistaceae bacterium]MBQ9581944.1 Holliday junction resolvase RuvX [Synergistaceae bacterium]MBQ9896802.1 Holliday junction resolvase RuvX [Synergistaceae bacterium]
MSEHENLGRVLALDIGTVRTGAAISDPMRMIAQGLDVWPHSEFKKNFEACVAEYSPTLILVGMPIRTDGSAGPEAKRIEALVNDLKRDYPNLKFETWDERFTTVIAQRAMIAADVSRKKRREHVDKVAAAVILQNWLEFNRALN